MGAENEISLTGIVEAIDDYIWVIGGRSVVVNGVKDVEDAIIVGSYVKVHFQVAADGSLIVWAIESADAEVEGEPGNDLVDNERDAANIDESADGAEENRGNVDDESDVSAKQEEIPDNEDGDDVDDGDAQEEDEADGDGDKGNGDDSNEAGAADEAGDEASGDDEANDDEADNDADDD